MKILIVSSYYPPHLGGLEIVAFNHANLLAKRGHEVNVLTSSVNKAEVSYVKNGVNVIRVKALNFIENKWGVPFPLFSIRFLWIAFREAKKSDVVHIHDVFYLSSFFAMLAARFYKKPVVLMQHVEMIKHPSKLVMMGQKLAFATTGAYVFKHSKKIITLNDRVDAFLMQCGVDNSKLVALPNGVDSTLFSPVSSAQKIDLKRKLGFSLDKKVVLFVGRFVPKKGFDKLMGASDDLYQLVFAGGTAPAGSDSRITFLGKLTQQELALVYQAADIFILPSEGEGFPLSVQEAMSSGLPIITTNDYGYVRYNFDRERFILLDDTSSKSIKETLYSIVNDNSKIRSMGEYSRSYALQYFSWDVVISELENLYKTLQ